MSSVKSDNTYVELNSLNNPHLSNDSVDVSFVLNPGTRIIPNSEFHYQHSCIIEKNQDKHKSSLEFNSSIIDKNNKNTYSNNNNNNNNNINNTNNNNINNINNNNINNTNNNNINNKNLNTNHHNHNNNNNNNNSESNNDNCNTNTTDKHDDLTNLSLN